MTEVPNTVAKYRQKRKDYEELAERIDDILFEVLDIEKINYALTDFRAKTIESFQTNLNDSKEDQIVLYDLAGIRVVGYVSNDVKKIVSLIHATFDVDEGKSTDKALELKPDQFGYRAIHLICTLPERRTILPEYKKFKGMFFEIQIKTILEHAWAQIEHDRNYKYKGLSEEIQHDFYLVAGILESADKQFDSINKRIEVYNKSISKKAEQGKLEEIEINAATLKRYLSDRFGHLFKLELSYGSGGSDGKTTIQELNAIGIHNLQQLEKIIPENFVEITIRSREMGDSSQIHENLASLVFNIVTMVRGETSYEIFKKTRNMSHVLFHKYFREYENAKQSISK